jgi:hypothetical protein
MRERLTIDKEQLFLGVLQRKGALSAGCAVARVKLKEREVNGQIL